MKFLCCLIEVLLGPLCDTQDHSKFYSRLIFYHQKEIKALKKGKKNSSFVCLLQDYLNANRIGSSWYQTWPNESLSGYSLLCQEKKGYYIFKHNQRTSLKLWVKTKISQKYWYHYCTRLTDFLEIFQGLIRINPQSMPVGYKRVIIVSNLQMLGGKKSVSWHFRNKFLLPFSLPFPLSLVK